MRFLRENWLFLLILGGMVTAWLALRTQGTSLPSTEAFDRQIASGEPVVVEFYSNT